MMKGTEYKDHDDILEELFSHATLRERPPVDTERSIREALHAQWIDVAGRRRRRNRVFALAAAAAVVMAVAVSGVLFRQPAGPAAGLDAAAVERMRGRAYLHAGDDAAATELGVGMRLKTAQALSTAHGAGLVLRWRNGIALRLDQNSRVVFISPQALELAAGQIYVDTADAREEETDFVLSTPAGPVRHIGTRYMAAVNFGSTSVAVREGRVSFGAGDSIASAGEKLFVDAAGDQRRERVALHGEEWQWADRLAEPVSPDGRSVAELLDWIAHETGQSVAYADAEAEQLAAETLLHGDVGLEPGQALELITQSTDLVADVREGTVLIDVAPAR